MLGVFEIRKGSAYTAFVGLLVLFTLYFEKIEVTTIIDDKHNHNNGNDNIVENECPPPLIPYEKVTVATCLKERYLVWQPHQSGFGSNFMVGLPFAILYAKSLNRTLVVGAPPDGWLYTNKLPGAAGVDGLKWERGNNLRFWQYYFDHPLITHPCSQIVSEIAGSDFSTEAQLVDNSARIITVNRDQGPPFFGLTKAGKIRGVPPHYLGDYRSVRSYFPELVKTLTLNARMGILARAFVMSSVYKIPNPLESSRSRTYVAMHIRGGDKATEVGLPSRELIMQYIDWLDGRVGEPVSLFLAGDDQEAIEAFMAHRPSGSTYRQPVVTLNPTDLAATYRTSPSSIDCSHPCLIMDILFDALFLSQAEVYFVTRRSTMSDIGEWCASHSGRTVVEMGSSFPFLTRKIRSHTVNRLKSDHHKNISFDGLFVDPRNSWTRELRGALVVDQQSMAQKVIVLFSLHPFLFLFANSNDGTDWSYWPEEVLCDDDEAWSAATPGIAALASEERQEACSQRPVQLLVAVTSPSMEALCKSSIEKGCFRVTDNSLDDFSTFLNVLVDIQRVFGLPDLSPEQSLLHGWWNRVYKSEVTPV